MLRYSENAPWWSECDKYVNAWGGGECEEW